MSWCNTIFTFITLIQCQCCLFLVWNRLDGGSLVTLAAREEEACLASMKIASPIFRNYEGSTCIVRSKSTIRKGDEITDNYGFFYQIHPEEERRETLSKQGPFINYVDLGWGIILSIFFSMFWFACFLSFMNLFDVSIHIPFLRKLLPQLLHLNGCFPSWPDVMSPFRFTFWIKLLSQMLHLNGFFPSWPT